MSTIKVNNIKPYSGGNVIVSGSTTFVVGNLQCNSDTILGDGATDTHTFTGAITASGNISSSGNVLVNDVDILSGVGSVKYHILGLTSYTASNNVSISNLNANTVALNLSSGSLETSIASLHALSSSYSTGTASFDYGLFGSSTVYIDGPNGHISASGDITASGINIQKLATFASHSVFGTYVNADKVTFNAKIKGDLRPNSDEWYDLGDVSTKWGNVYAGHVQTYTASITEAVIVSASINTFYTSGSAHGLPTSEADAHIGGLFTLSGSQIFSSSAWTSGHIINNATSMSKFVFMR